MVELRVQRGGKDELVYVLRGPKEAAEYIDFLSDFWNDAEYLLQPLRH